MVPYRNAETSRRLDVVKAPRFNPKKLGIAFIVLAVIMFIVEQVWKPVFTLPITESFGFPVWTKISVLWGYEKDLTPRSALL